MDLRDLFGAAGRRIVEQVRDAGDRSRQAALIERGLARRILSGPALTPEVGHVWRRLTAAGGYVSIGGLPDDVGWTHRHLIDRFRREIGVTPKTAARLLRLDHLWRSLDRVDGGATGHRGYR